VSDKKALTTTYLQGEGRNHLDACMEATFSHCLDHAVNVIVIYTATGDGPCLAVERYLPQPEYSKIRLVAVTPPANRTFVADSRTPDRTYVKTGIFRERRELLEKAGVSIVSARLPFQSLVPAPVPDKTSDPMELVERAFGVLGGGFAYCLQAVLMACDAGAVRSLERVAAMSADTALVAIASHSEAFLSPKLGMLVEHIICRPALYDISKHLHFMTEFALSTNEPITQTELPLEPGAAEAEAEPEATAEPE
jgi:hypothetical protein